MSDRQAMTGAPSNRAWAGGGAGGFGVARALAVVLVALLAAVIATRIEQPGLLRHGLVAAAVAMLTAVGLFWLRALLRRHDRNRVLRALSGFIEHDSVASFVSDDDGRVKARNTAAEGWPGAADGETLAACLRALMADPSPVLSRLQFRALSLGAAHEDVVTRIGAVRIAVHRLGDDGFLWRLESLADHSRTARSGESQPLPMLTVGRAGTILYMNESARRLVGRRVKTLDGLFTRQPVRAGEICEISTENGPLQVVVSDHSASGGRREIHIFPLSPDRREEDSCPAGRFGDALLNALPVAAARLDGAGRIRALNAPAADLLGEGIEIGEKIGFRLVEADGTGFDDWLAETLARDRERRTEVFRLGRVGGETHVQVTVGRSGGGEVIAIMQDATEMKSLEAQFVQSQKMQAIGQLAGGIAHDFNNLLTAISGHCDLLLLRHDSGDQDYADLIQIHQNANRAAALVGQLLAFSRKQTLRPELLDLRDTLADLTHLLNRLVGEKVTLTLSHDPVLRPIRADKRQLEQVLLNLVVNARDAMPNGGEIRIETEVVTLEEPLRRDRATVPAGDYVVVRVRDEGIGIERENLQKVFEPFYTTKRTGEGTGLGLSTVYGIVKQTGGFIFVDSAPGHGAEFVLYFPACEATAEERQRDGTSDAPGPSHGHGEGVVLLVEDEAPVRAFASRALRLRGYTVLEAASAEEALELLEDSSLRVDVFVTDVVMPGMDGPTWVRKARALRPGTRVIFMSGYAEGAFGDTGPDMADAAFLPKPFSLDQLAEAVREQIS